MFGCCVLSVAAASLPMSRAGRRGWLRRRAGVPWVAAPCDSVLLQPHRYRHTRRHTPRVMACCRYVPVLAGAAVGVRGASGSGPVKARGNFQVRLGTAWWVGGRDQPNLNRTQRKRARGVRGGVRGGGRQVDEVGVTRMGWVEVAWGGLRWGGYPEPSARQDKRWGGNSPLVLWCGWRQAKPTARP